MCRRHIPALLEARALVDQALVDPALEGRALEDQELAQMAPRQDLVPATATPVLTAWTAGFVHLCILLQPRFLVGMAGLAITVRAAGSVFQTPKLRLQRRRHPYQCMQTRNRVPMPRFLLLPRPRMGINTLAVTRTTQIERLEMPSSWMWLAG